MSEGLSPEIIEVLKKLSLDGKRRTDARRRFHLEGVAYDKSDQQESIWTTEIKQRLTEANEPLAAVISKLYETEKTMLQHDIPSLDPVEDRALDSIENIVGMKLPAQLRDFYTKVGDGGVGPSLGIYDTNDLLERYRWSIFDPIGPWGKQWPKHLLPIWGNDWACVSVNLDDGTLAKWDVGELVEVAGRISWGRSFIWVANSLEEWLRKWLQDIGMGIPTEEAAPVASVIKSAEISQGAGNYFERYRKGECEAVWSELGGLGEGILDEPVRSEAQAVARETMQRARRNIEKIVHRLAALGYQFEDGASSPVEAQDTRVFMPPPDDTPDLITKVEKELGGPLPLSLHAFYEQVGSICLLGSHEVLNPSYRGQTELADPLLIFGLDDLVEQLDDMPEEERANGAELMIAPDDITKAGASGAFYYVDLPCRAADFDFRHFRRDNFVGYLRTVFKWGGFPGWERSEHAPHDLIAQLTKDLEPV